MDRVLPALRTDLRFFFRKVFATVYPGETYSHNWHIEAIAYQLMRGTAKHCPLDRRAGHWAWLQRDAYVNRVPIVIPYVASRPRSLPGGLAHGDGNPRNAMRQ
jgi:hypothetical protein